MEGDNKGEMSGKSARYLGKFNGIDVNYVYVFKSTGLSVLHHELQLLLLN